MCKRIYGRVETFDRQKRWGFIAGDDGRRYYVSSGSINVPSKTLDAGYSVVFTATCNNRGYRAEDVSLL